MSVAVTLALTAAHGHVGSQAADGNPFIAIGFAVAFWAVVMVALWFFYLRHDAPQASAEERARNEVERRKDDAFTRALIESARAHHK